MFALLDLFTTVSVSPRMWQMLQVIFEAFGRDAFDNFTGLCLADLWCTLAIMSGDVVAEYMMTITCVSTDMVSVLYNFVKVDVETFLSDTKHVEIIMSMCKTVCLHDDKRCSCSLYGVCVF